MTIFKVDKNEKVVSVAKIDESEEEESNSTAATSMTPTPDATVGEDLASGEEA